MHDLDPARGIVLGSVIGFALWVALWGAIKFAPHLMEARSMVTQLILLVLAFVLFALATVGVPSGRFNFVAGGLACLALVHIIGYSGGRLLP